jgi:hypothetical protein
VNPVDAFGGRTPLVGSAGSLQSGFVAGLFKDSADKIPILLRAIENNSDSTLVAVPQILATNNKEAVFEIRSAIPTARTDTNNVATTTSFGGNEEAVTELKITPSISLTQRRDSHGKVIRDANNQIMTQNFIRLEIDQKITRFVGESTDPALPPSKLERNAKTEITIPDDATVVIGGFTSFNDSRAIDKVPYLVEMVKKIPLIGSHILGPILEPLLQRKTNTRERTTLYMFVTPHIIPDLEGLKTLKDRLIKEDDIENLKEQYNLITDFEKNRRQEEAEDKQKEFDRGKKRLLAEERYQLRHLKKRWNTEAEEIRVRGEESGLDDEEIDWQIATTRRCREDMFVILQALESYKIRNGSYPSTMKGLSALYEKDKDGLPPLLYAKIIDPWGAEYQYLLRDGRPVVRSYGGNRAPGGLGFDKDLEMSILR